MLQLRTLRGVSGNVNGTENHASVTQTSLGTTRASTPCSITMPRRALSILPR
jgi:hypothetical protein